MIGVEFDSLIKAKDISVKLLAEGIVTGTAGENVLRILPPFIIIDEEINHFAKILTSILYNI